MESVADDVPLQVDLRLRLDEVAEVEAKQLRIRARRRPTKRELCGLASRMYDARRTRDRMLNRDLFGEPAWDMLLALYALPARGWIMTVKAVTCSADVPPTTGHRWQQCLINEGLIERGPQEHRFGKTLLRLTPKGRELIDGYLTRLFYLDTPLPPDPDD
jgi:DNA-binding MarR family transcriptional regulator